MPFLSKMVEDGAIHATMKTVSNHKRLSSLVAGVDEKYYFSALKSWILGFKYDVNNLVDNAQNSWLIGNEEMNSYFNGESKIPYFLDHQFLLDSLSFR